jgi:predicted MFS family arabinose efflux permease
VKSPAAWPALAVLFLVNVLNFYDRQALSAVLEPLRHEFQLTDTQLGGLVTMFTVVFALAGLPLGRLADTARRKRLLALGVAAWTGLTALGGLAVSYGMLLGTRLGVGIGEAVCTPAATSWIGDLVTARQRARAMAGFMMAVPVGIMLSSAISGPVAQAYGWRVALMLAAAPGLVLVPAVLGLTEPVRSAGSAPRGSLRGLMRIPALWWVAVSGALLNFVLYSFSTFLPAFLTRVHGLSVAQAGVWTGIGSGASGILGGMAAGIWGDRIIRTRHNGRMLLAAGTALIAALPAVVAIQLPPGSVAAAVPLLMAAYGLLQMYYGLVYSSIQDLVEPGMRGTAMAAYFVVTYLGGASWGPLITGRLSDHFAWEAARASGSAVITEASRAIGLHQAMYVIPMVSVALAVVLWMGARAMRGEAADFKHHLTRDDE